ncbi:EAL domain-containing protein [Pseudochelatococcus sp. B33]
MAMIAVLEPRETQAAPFAVPAGIRGSDVVVESFGSPDCLMEWARSMFAPAPCEAGFPCEAPAPAKGPVIIVINSGAIDDATIALLRDLRRTAPATNLVVISEKCDHSSSLRAFEAGAMEVLTREMGQETKMFRLRRVLALARHGQEPVRTRDVARPDIDRVTNLPSQPFFQEEVKRRIARAGDNAMAFHVVNIDSFDIVNNAFAPAVGQRLLEVCANRLRNILGRDHSVGRFGANGFAVLQCNVGAPHDVEALARQISAQLCAPSLIEGHHIRLAVTIGIARFPQDGRGYEELAHRAGLAAGYGAQADRRGVSFFHDSMLSTARKTALLNIELRNALATQQFFLEFQPQVDLLTGRLLGGEALVRWRRPDGSVTPPGEFLPYAEESGLIVALDEWVLFEACRTARHWHDAGLDLRVSINLSATQFARRGIPNLIAHALQETRLDPARLDIELTESVVMQDVDRVRDDLARIRALGASISIDDFGVGHSSLHLLRQLRVDRLKIDKEFIRNLSTSPSDRVILRTIVGLGHELGFSVIAEGVETADQLAILQEEGCDEVQGFLFARPMAARDFLAYAQHRPTRPARRNSEPHAGAVPSR